MNSTHRSSRAPCGVRTAIALAAALTLLPAQALQISANWIGPPGGSYGVPGNWDIGVVPLNNASTTFSVGIGLNKSVVYSVLELQQIDQFLLDTGSSFSLVGNSLIQPTDLTVLGRSLIAGSISADNASFTATGTGTKFVGSKNVATASRGGVVRIGAPSIDASAFLTSTTFLSATGSGSLVDLSSAQSLNAGSQPNGTYTLSVAASSQGVVNLSGVKTVTAPTNAADSLAFNASSGGRIDLTSLQTVSGLTVDTSTTFFNADGGRIDLGPLKSANRIWVSLQNGSTMAVGGFAGNASITNSRFLVSGGSQLNGAGLVGDFSVRDFLSSSTILGASGAGSVLNLSGLRSIDAGSQPNGTYTHTVSAADTAVVNLSGVKTLVAPANAADTLAFSAINGGRIDLSSLQSLAGLTIDTGYTTFFADAATIALGPLQSANHMQVTLQNGALMTAGGFAGDSTITNSRFLVSGGSVLDAPNLRGEFAVRGFASGSTILGAAGAGSRLNLPGLSRLDAGSPPNGTYSQTVSATDGAVIDLSGVRTLVAPANAADTLAFSVIRGGRIDLSSLQTASGLTIDTGNTTFSGDAGSFNLGALQTANRMSVDLQNGSTMTVGGYAGNSVISNGRFLVSGGSQLNGAALRGEYSVRAFASTSTILGAAGAGSLLDLSGLHTLNAASPQNGTYSHFVSASDRGVINLSGVRTVVTPDISADSLVFAASSQGTIDISSLRTVTSAAGGGLQFNASTGGRIVVGGFAAGPGVRFSAVDTGSSLGIAGSLSLLNGSTLSAGAGTRIDISGDFSFQQTVESQVNTDLAFVNFSGAGAHTLEVGGRRAASLPAAGAVVTSNFAIGQLSVGQDGVAETLVLVDAIDNGNRSSPEVLYLNGAAGANGLHILGGSTVLLSNVDLYFTENGNWVHANELFQNGATTIAYDQGFISLVPEPGSVALLLAGLGVVGLRRRQTGLRE